MRRRADAPGVIMLRRMLGPALRRARVRDRPGLRTLVALLASALLNALTLWWLEAAGAFSAPRPVERTAVALAPVAPRAWAENRRVEPAQPPPAAEDGRVIEQPPEQPPSDRPPEASRFLSDRNVRVEREKVSRDAGRYPRLAPRPEAGDTGPRSPRVAGRAAPAGEAARPPRPRGTGSLPGERVARAEGLAVPSAPDADSPAGADRPVPPPPGAAAPGAPGRPATPPDLRPSAESLARIAGGPSMDGYRDAEEGDATALSSREFRFATFLNQMRSAIGDVWYPSVEAAIRERDPEGKSFFYRERTVVLVLTLGPEGELRRLSVSESSQVPFVDEVAVAAVRKAQPFSNPPRAMFGPEGEARVPFAFTVFPFEHRGVLRWRQPVSR